MKNDKKGNKKLLIISIIAVIILTILGTVLVLLISDDKQKTEDLAYTELISKANLDEVEKIEMKSGSSTAEVKLKNDDTKYKTLVPSMQPFIEFIQEKKDEGKEIEVIQKEQNPLITGSRAFLSLLPTLLLVVLLVLVFQMQGLGEKGKVYDAESNKNTQTNFEDVAGMDEEKEELIEIVEFLKEPKSFLEMGAKIPKGVLLCGKPGTGKTLVARAIAGEAKVPFISMSGSEFIEMFAGLGASRVRKLFEKAKKLAPCIVFIDEIDAIGARRTSASGAETENNQTLNQLLVEMDGFSVNQTIIVLAATNRPEMLDKALLRPGRFDRQITIAPPDLKGREEILKIHSKNKKLAQDLDLKEIAEDTAGLTGAELANILNEAAIIATKNKHEAIKKSDIEDAVKKVTVGLEKHSRVISKKDKKLTAYHEAGHAVVSKFLETQNQVKEISIIPRGIMGGYTMYRTNEDKLFISKTEMEEKLVALLGGRVAEQVALNDISTGASNDIEVATKIAKDMVTVYGMSEKIGPMSITIEDVNHPEIFGEDIANAVTSEVKVLIDKAYNTAKTILSNNMDLLHAVANRLLEKEIISAKEFDEFFK